MMKSMVRFSGCVRFRAHCSHTGGGVLWHAVNLGHRLSGKGTHTCASTFKRTQQVHGQHSKCIYKEPEGPNMEGPVSMDISRHSSLCSMMQTFCGWGRGRALLSRTVLIRRKSVWFTTANGNSYEEVYLPGL